MLKASSLVVLSKHVRTLLAQDDRVTRPQSDNSNVMGYGPKKAGTEPGTYVPQKSLSLDAWTSGHGSGV